MQCAESCDPAIQNMPPSPTASGVPTKAIAFTELFIAEHWKFGRNSFVFVAACQSDNALLQQVLFDAGAAVVAGWDGNVTTGRNMEASKLAFDRLLGANVYFPEDDGPQRPFDYLNVAHDLQQHGFDRDEEEDGTPLRLSFRASSSSQFGLLAPTIAFLGVDEPSSELMIDDSFTVPRGTREERHSNENGEEVVRLTWDAIAPRHAPDPTAAR